MQLNIKTINSKIKIYFWDKQAILSIGMTLDKLFLLGKGVVPCFVGDLSVRVLAHLWMSLKRMEWLAGRDVGRAEETIQGCMGMWRLATERSCCYTSKPEVYGGSLELEPWRSKVCVRTSAWPGALVIGKLQQCHFPTIRAAPGSQLNPIWSQRASELRWDSAWRSGSRGWAEKGWEQIRVLGEQRIISTEGRCLYSANDLCVRLLPVG